MHLHFKALFESERSRMRAGGFTMQQGLTSEAATIVKQAVNLARRRGHAQVTPLHVAHTMLSNPTGLLRTACLQSHSHPLQCRALELCFNVALNRLPASTSSPMLGPQHSQLPSISNALVAAFKRAQAHQRRGSIENQQQPLLAVKIELEQLIISILDDPSVSRVMREASFSSTQVKSNVEQIVSLEICSQNPNSATSKSKESNIPSKVGNNPIRASDDRATDEGAASVIDNLMNKNRRNTVIVGECLATIEGVVRGVMEKFDKGDVPEDLRHVKFIRLPLSSFAHFSREETEHKLVEIRSHVRGYAERGVVLFLGDLLKWTSEYRASSGHHDGQQHGRNNHYCAVEHMIMELGKLVCGNGENGRFWLMGIATFQTYMRCKTGHPSLETVWDLHPLTIPADSLSLSLNSDSSQSQFKGKKAGNGPSWLLQLEGEEETARKLTCCTDCSANFEMEARSLRSRTACNSDSITTSSLPTWLQQYKDENKRVSSNDQDCIQVRELCKKWNSICTSAHKQQQPHSSSEKTLTFSSVSPSSSTYSGFSYDQHNPNKHKSIHQGGWPVMEHKQPWNDHHFWVSEAVNKTIEPSLRLYIPEHTDRIHPFSSNPNSTPNSASSSDVMEMDQYFPRFKELNPQNLQTLCSALEKKVPWQKKIIPEIATTILQCRSGMVKRKRTTWPKTNEAKKEETWLFFQGVDAEGKEKIARELARLVFGSQSNCVSIALSSFSSTRADSTDDLLNSTKRSRDEQSCSYIERFAEAVTRNPHRVFLVEDIEQADYYSQIGIKRSIERGRVTNSDGEEVSVGDAIVILSCESFSSRSRACSPPIKQKSDEADQEGKLGPGGVDQETSPCVSLDLNMSIDDDCVDDTSIDDIGLLEAVDRRVVFKIIEL